jgi:magnesium transporter
MIQTLIYRDHRYAGANPPDEQLATLRADPAVMLWVDLSESSDDEARRVLGEWFAVHPLTIEDCLQDSPLPKVEQYDDYLYIVMHAVDYTRADKFNTTEVDFVLGKNFLVTYHRKPLKPVQVARERLQRNTAVLVRGPDRIAHTLLDLLADYYGPALAELRTEIEDLEEAVLDRAKTGLDARIVELRNDLSALRQIIRPQRELVGELAQGRSTFFRKKLLPYLRDLHDEFQRIEEMGISWADQAILLFRVYLNRSSHEANEGIRVLTALTAITLPLLIIGGWFGMNFRAMPLLDSRVAYWSMLGVTVVVTAGLFIFLRRRKWF